MYKVMTAVAEHSYVVPTRITVREYFLKEWLPAIKGTVRPTTFASYTTQVKGHIVPALGSLQLARSPPRRSTPSMPSCFRTGACRAGLPLPRHRAARACHPASGMS